MSNETSIPQMLCPVIPSKNGVFCPDIPNPGIHSPGLSAGDFFYIVLFAIQALLFQGMMPVYRLALFWRYTCYMDNR
ncbi:hypothetical protein [Legionella israelensis]|nr:hypothetical protein [Legionella israelensis]